MIIVWVIGALITAVVCAYLDAKGHIDELTKPMLPLIIAGWPLSIVFFCSYKIANVGVFIYNQVVDFFKGNRNNV